MQGNTDHPETTMTHIIYALQAASLIFGITFLVAVIINYIKRGDVRNSWLDSHFSWQIKTFWYSLLWTIVGVVLTYVLVGFAILVLAYIWVIYRIVKGWLYLKDGKAMYT